MAPSHGILWVFILVGSLSKAQNECLSDESSMMQIQRKDLGETRQTILTANKFDNEAATEMHTGDDGKDGEAGDFEEWELAEGDDDDQNDDYDNLVQLSDTDLTQELPLLQRRRCCGHRRRRCGACTKNFGESGHRRRRRGDGGRRRRQCDKMAGMCVERGGACCTQDANGVHDHGVEHPDTTSRETTE